MLDNKKKKYIWFLIPSLLFFITSLFPVILFSAEVEYQLLAPVPQLTINPNAPNSPSTASSYIPGLVKLIIGVAGILVVLRLIFAGIKYMSTDAFEGKSDAKNDIQNALWGFGLIIAAWLILNTINPALVNFDLKIERLEVGDAFDTGMGSTTVSAEDLHCNNCVSLNTLPYSEIPTKSCAGGCYLEHGFAASLYELFQDSKAQGVNWRITEAYPPTVKHASLCHQPNNSKTGTCADISITDKNTPDNVRKFLVWASDRGLKAVYEVQTLEEQNNWRSSTGLGSNSIIARRYSGCRSGQDPEMIDGRPTKCCPANLVNDIKDKTCSWVTGPHFHVSSQ